MSETEFLLWVRGPALQVATIVFLVGAAWLPVGVGLIQHSLLPSPKGSG